MSTIQQLLVDSFDIWTAADVTKKSGRGRSSNNLTSVYGIKKIRELILELAVRGKLVPQDPNDESASKLLKRIQAEKAKGIASGEIKKGKLLALIKDDEKPFELPHGWEWTTLASICLINPRNNEKDNVFASFVPMTMIDSTFNSLHGQEARLWKEIKKGFTHFSEGDIGIAKITPCFENSKACVFSGLTNRIGAGTTELHIIRPIKGTIVSRYVLAYVKSPPFLMVGKTKMTGTAGQKRLPKEFVESNPFPLPPLAEQHRIVAKIDELMALCDQLEMQHKNAVGAHEKLVANLLSMLVQSKKSESFLANWQRIAVHFDILFTTEGSINALKKTLLQLAMMGKLVPQDPNDESASKLLKRIQAEKAKGIASGKMKKGKPLALIKEDEKPFELPHGWEWVRFGNIYSLEYGDNLPAEKRSNSGEYPVYGSNGIVGSHNVSFVHAPCIVVGRKGSAGALNLSFLTGCCVTDVAYYCIPEKNLDLFFSFKLFQTLGLDSLGKGIKPGLNRNEAYELLIAIPPLAEQHRIVAKIDELMALCDQLKAGIHSADRLQQILADTLVQKAVV